MVILDIFLLLLASALVLFRFIKGPTLSDRVVAFDIMSIIAVALLLILALFFQRELYLDIALVMGLIGFLGATIFGRYMEKGI